MEHSHAHSFPYFLGCFYTTTAKLNSCYRGHRLRKLKIFSIWPITEKVCQPLFYNNVFEIFLLLMLNGAILSIVQRIWSMNVWHFLLCHSAFILNIPLSCQITGLLTVLNRTSWSGLSTLAKAVMVQLSWTLSGIYTSKKYEES